jgi:hypothetical protein
MLVLYGHAKEHVEGGHYRDRGHDIAVQSGVVIRILVELDHKHKQKIADAAPDVPISIARRPPLSMSLIPRYDKET